MRNVPPGSQTMSLNNASPVCGDLAVIGATVDIERSLPSAVAESQVVTKS